MGISQTEEEERNSRQEIVQSLIELADHSQKNRIKQPDQHVDPVYMKIISPDNESGDDDSYPSTAHE